MIRKKIINTFLILLSLCMLWDCSPKEESGNNAIKVVATTGMIFDAAYNIAGDSIILDVLMGPGVDPHLYKATQGDVRKLNQADVILYNGLHLEGKMGEIFDKLRKVKNVVPVAESLPDNLIIRSEAFQNAVDPHIWFDVSRWKYAVIKISETLVDADPKNAPYYRANTRNYLQKLDSLHRYVREAISEIPEERRILITSHDAFGYYGDAYDIDVKGLQGISTLSEYGLKDLANMSDLIIEKNIRSVFVETSISERAIRSLVEGVNEKGHEVKIGGSLYSDAMGDPDTPEGTYIGMVKYNTQKITDALK